MARPLVTGLTSLGMAAVLGGIGTWLLFFSPAPQTEQVETTGEMAGFTYTAGTPPAPDVSFTDGEGTTLSLDDFAGQAVLMNFWATWCAPCVHEMPTLEALQQQLGGEAFQVVAVSIDRGGMHQVGPFLEEQGLADLPPYLDPAGDVPRAFEARGFPTTVLIDAQGRWIGTLEGMADWSSPEAIRLIRHHMPG